MKISAVRLAFNGKPNNYLKIDEYVSRSAQPQKDDFKWLSEQGVTDVFNFRTMAVTGVDFDEKTEVERYGMRYHNIPSVTKLPKEENVDRFLKEVEEVKSREGKAHIHCKAGADRTGMYAFIYKSKQNIGNVVDNLKEWIALGHNKTRYPNLEDWACRLVKKKFNK